jgi:hypothetical protein
MEFETRHEDGTGENPTHHKLLFNPYAAQLARRKQASSNNNNNNNTSSMAPPRTFVPLKNTNTNNRVLNQTTLFSSTINNNTVTRDTTTETTAVAPPASTTTSETSTIMDVTTVTQTTTSTAATVAKPYGSIANGAESTNTVRRKRSAIERWDEIMKKTEDDAGEDKLPKFDDLELKDIGGKGDNFKLLLGRYCDYIGNNPQYNKKSKDELKEKETDTLIKEFEGVISAFRKKFPNHEYLHQSEWVAEMKKSMATMINRRRGLGSKGDDLKNAKKRPLFDEVTEERYIVLKNEEGAPTLPTIDLARINIKILQSGRKDAASSALRNVKAMAGDTRPGEVKFLDWKKGWWESKYNCLFMRAYQPKQFIVSLSAITCHYRNWALCPPTLTAIQWIVEDGLLRTNDDSPLTDSFVFQDLIDLDDNTTANRMTARIQEHLPASEKSYYSSKSIRIGATTLLQNHPQVLDKETICTGGWSTGNTKDSYAWPLLATLLPGMKCLMGHPDPRSDVFPPRLSVLVDDGGVSVFLIESFIDHLYAIHVVCFKRNGHLRPYLDMATACFIMHFPVIVETLGKDHKIYTAVMNAACRAKICGEGRPNSWAASWDTMVKWSNLIKQDYENRKLEGNASQPMVNEDRERLIAVQKEQKQRLSALEDAAKSQERHSKKLRTENQKLHAKVDILAEQYSSSTATNKELHSKVDFLIKQQSSTDAMLRATDAMLRAVLAAQQPGMAMPPVPALPPMLALPTRAGAFTGAVSMSQSLLNVSQDDDMTHHENDTASASKSMNTVRANAFEELMASGGRPFAASLFINDVLEWLYDNKKLIGLAGENAAASFQVTFGSYPVKDSKHNASKYRGAMELVLSLLTQEERVLFAACSQEASERTKAKQAFEAIANAAIAVRAIILGKSEVNVRCRATYIAIGTTVAEPKAKANLMTLLANLAGSIPPKTLRQHAIEFQKQSENKSKSGKRR